MKTPSKPATPPTTFASPPRTTPPTARSAGLRNRPSSAAPPRADRTANSPNKRSAHAPKEMGDHPLNLSAGPVAGAGHGEGRARGEVARRQLRVARQPVHLRLVHEQVERVEPAERAIRVCAVQLGLDAL